MAIIDQSLFFILPHCNLADPTPVRDSQSSVLTIERVDGTRKGTYSHLILSYFNGINSESSYKQKWIPIELLCDQMNLRFNVEDDMKFTKTMLTRTIFKIHGKTERKANKVVLAENLLIEMYWHSGHREKGSGWREFVYLTMEAGFKPKFPSGKNASLWVDACVARRLCGGRKDGNVVSEEIFTKVMTPSANKRNATLVKKAARNSDNTADDSHRSDSLYDRNQPHVSGFVDWWTSGNAWLFFSPCGKYNNNCNVKDIVMDRIELLESVNQNSSNWRLVVEEGDKENACSSNDVFMIQERCIYLVIALHKFVNEEQTGMRWTWKKCIMHFMSEMNNVGVEVYTNDWQPLQQSWHSRIVTRFNNTFLKAPSAKQVMPPSQ